MKRWQKITGCILVSLLIAVHLGAILDYIILTEWTASFCAEVEQTEFVRWLDAGICHFYSYNILSLVDCCIVVFLFICLWREKENRACHSSVNVIPYGKIEYPFTFNRTYCRIGVVTDDSGIERMETYFVCNNKMAICYKNRIFSHVVIDDTRYDKNDNYKMNTGTIVGIRMTEGLASHIVKLHDGRLIVFAVHPRGYGELYENCEFCTPNENGYADYLAEYEQGTDIEL